MTDPRLCTHAYTVPVDVRDHTTGGTRTVARICTVCLDQLHAGWGCDDCAWVEGPRRLSDPRVTPLPVLVHPCPAHEGADG